MTDKELVETIEATLGAVLDEKVQPLIDAKFRAADERRFRQLTFIISLLSLIGVGAFYFLISYTAERAVDKRIGVQTTRLNDAVALSEFSIRASKIDEADSFSDEDAEFLMGFLREHSQGSDIPQLDGFNLAFDKTVGSFVSADRSSDISEILDLYPNHASSNVNTLRQILHHLGQKILSRPFTPANDETLKRFESLEARAPKLGFPELSLVYRLPFTAEASPDEISPDVVRMLDHISSMKPADIDNFFTQILARTRAKNWMNTETVEGKTVSRKLQNFLSLYRAEIIEKFLIDDPRLLDVAIAGELEVQLCSQYATAIVKGETREFTEQLLE